MMTGHYHEIEGTPVNKLHENVSPESTEVKVDTAAKGGGSTMALASFIILWLSTRHNWGMDPLLADTLAALLLGGLTWASARFFGRRQLSPTSAVSAGFDAKLAQRLQLDRNPVKPDPRLPGELGQLGLLQAVITVLVIVILVIVVLRLA